MDITYRSYSYAYLLMVVHRAQRRLNEGHPCYVADCLTALIFSALAFEAFTNHVGRDVFKCWEPLKRKLSPTEKLDVIAESKGTHIDWGKRPYQSVVEIVKLRNKIAHAETELVPIEIISLDKFNKKHWPSMCRPEVVNRLCPDVEEVIRSFPEKIGISMPKKGLLAEPIPESK